MYHLPGSPCRTIGSPSPHSVLYSVQGHHFCGSSVPFSYAPTRSIPGPGGWSPSTHLASTPQPQSCFPALPNLTSSRPALGTRRRKAHGDSRHRPQALRDIYPFFFWATSPSSVPMRVPLKLLSQEAGVAGQTQSAFNNKDVTMINKSKYTMMRSWSLPSHLVTEKSPLFLFIFLFFSKIPFNLYQVPTK